MMPRMTEWLFIWIFDPIAKFFVSFTYIYHLIISSLFVNVAIDESEGLERAADTFLAPFHYVFDGKIAKREGDGWVFVQRYDYVENFGLKLLISSASLSWSLPLGLSLKTLSYFFSNYKNRYESVKKNPALKPPFKTDQIYFRSLSEVEEVKPQGYLRPSQAENHLVLEKRALKEVTDLLSQEKICWWVDCGTCLGAFRYGGVIPWDFDVDIAVLLPDFDLIFHVLQKLDPKQYAVQDWSGRDRAKSLIKVYIKESGSFLDIYHFDLNLETFELHYILSLENNIFLPESWKVRERRFKVPVSFSDVFPLKKAQFDGFDVFVPRHMKPYLQRYYGDDLSPAKLYNPETQAYEKNESHPYWQREHVH